MKERWEEFWFCEVPACRIAAFRVTVATLTMVIGMKWVRHRIRDYLRTDFHSPVLSWLPALPDELGTPLLLGMWLASALLLLGWRPRLSAGLLASGWFYLLLLDETHYENNVYFHGTLLLLLAFARGGCSLRELVWPGDGIRTTVAWPEHLVRIQLGIVFFYAALDKVFSPDWGTSGHKLLELTHGATGLLIFEPLAALYPWPLASLAGIASLGTIALEFGIAAGCLVPRLWPLAAWLGFGFAAFVEVSLQPRLFGWDIAAVLLLFLPAATRSHTLRGGPRLFRRVDWHRRLRFEAGEQLQLGDPHGRTSAGIRALCRIAILLPAPLLLLVLAVDQRFMNERLGIVAGGEVVIVLALVLALIVAGDFRARSRARADQAAD